MLLELSPLQLEKWRIAYKVIPLGDSWKQTDTICGAIKDEAVISRYSNAGEKKIPAKELHKTGDYIPKVQKKVPRPIVNQPSIDLAERLIEQQFRP